MQTWYYQEQGGIMKRLGDSWVQYSTGDRYRLLGADNVIHYGGHPGYNRRVNHHNFQPFEYIEAKGKYVYMTPPFSNVYPAMSGNFLGDDGHVKRYSVPEGYGSNGKEGGWKDNFTSVGNQIVPLEFQSED